MSKRFRVVCSDDAKTKQYPEADTFPDLCGGHFWCLYEFKDDVPVRLVGNDGGEPEDQLLIRDWSWVVTELNRLAEEC